MVRTVTEEKCLKGGNGVKNKMLQFPASIVEDEEGIGVVEVILILLVLVGLVIIFKDQIVALARSIFSNITGQVGNV